MSRYPLGQPVRVFTTVTDATGMLVNAGALTLLVKRVQADGTWLTTGTYTAPVNDSTGKYHQDIPAADLATAGHYQYTWTSTGTGSGVAYSDFDVFDPFEISVLPLQDAKDMLNIPQSTTAYDGELLAWIASIESSLERFTGGPVVNRQVTERCEAVNGYRQIILRQRPVVSVTSITAESGGPVSVTDIKVDPNSGTVQRSTGWPIPGPFLYSPWFSVVYVAGWGTSVPPAFSNFARIVIDHNWALQRMPVALPMSSEDAVSIPGFSAMIPRRAAELLNGSYNGIPFSAEAVV